jgi:polyisoprenoid-binding protein YceI
MSPVRGATRAALAAVLAAVAGAAPGQQAVDYAQSRIGFVSRQMNVPVEGEFTKFVASVRWNAARPEASEAQVDIDAGSCDFGEQSLNDEAKGRSFLDARAHPRAAFASTAVRPLGAGRFEVAGRLTIKGVTREVVVPFTVRREGASRVFDGAVTIRRLDFRVGEGEWTDTRTLADEVQVKFRLVAADRP